MVNLKSKCTAFPVHFVKMQWHDSANTMGDKLLLVLERNLSVNL